MKSKNCFKCKRKLPLFMFHKQPGYSVPACLGRVYVCRICTFKESKNSVVRQQKNGKFKVVKLTIKERIKELWAS